MFCENCGTELKEDWKACPVCGKEVDISYMFFPNFRGKNRERCNIVMIVLNIIVTVSTTLAIFGYIISEIQAGENYKIVVYIIRFFNSDIPGYCLWQFIIGYITGILISFDETEGGIADKRKIKLVMGIEIVASIVGLFCFINAPLAETAWTALGYSGIESILKYLWAVKGGVFLWIIAAIMKYIQESYMDAEAGGIKQMFEYIGVLYLKKKKK